MRGIVLCRLTAITATAAMNVAAYAAPIGDPSSITVPVAASDFATESAKEKLVDRLRAAAREVCKGESWGDDGYLFTRACQSLAMEDALAQVERLRDHVVAALSASSVIVAAR
jgi:UrcA family protein